MLRPHVLSLAKTCANTTRKCLPESITNTSNIVRYASTSSESNTFKLPESGASASFQEKVKSEDWQKGDGFQNEERITEKCVNSVTLLGRVGNNPVLRGTENNPLVSFSLATSIHYRPGGDNSGNDLVKKTEWHNIAVFKPYLRETAHNYISKGSRVMVQGRIMYGSYEDANGVVRHTTSIAAEDIIRFAPGSNSNDFQ